jgi:endonuclease-3
LLKQERADYVLKRLQQLYPAPPIPLDHSDPFSLLIAVLLSAQCTDARVNTVTPALFQLADNPASMAEQDIETVRGIIRPCGLSPKKSRAIVHLSRRLMDVYNGEVPDDMAALETLPGVGHKTASVVMSQVFGVPAFAVDTHIHRLAQRWGLTNGKNVAQTEKDLKHLFPQESWNALHLQIIYYGREYCSARGCNGTICEICQTCYPRRRLPKKTKKA